MKTNNDIISSVEISPGETHDRVTLWNRGGNAGTLVVCHNDAQEIAQMLGVSPEQDERGLTIDQARVQNPELQQTMIMVRAKDKNGIWKSCDISALDKESLFRWLRSRGGSNKWAESIVGILLGHKNHSY